MIQSFNALDALEQPMRTLLLCVSMKGVNNSSKKVKEAYSKEGVRWLVFEVLFKVSDAICIVLSYKLIINFILL